MRLFALFLCLLAAPLAAEPDPAGLDRYAQTLILDFGAEEAASAAVVSAAPLHKDAKWAFSQRWDDNLVDSLRVRDLMNRHRMRGTFYLNASDAWYSNESRYPFAGDPRKELAGALMKGGHSIGGHTLTHNFVPDLNRPEMFWEVFANRVDREVNSQSPVTSFVFPFNAFHNSLEGDVCRHDIAEVVARGGYLHVADQYFTKELGGKSPLLDSWLLPPDGAPIDGVVKSLLASDKQREREPVMCLCMHAWPASWGGPAFPKLDKAMRRWKGRSIWWYANANELAAYRYQARYGELVQQREGGRLKVAVDRFEPWDLGDGVGLTLKVAGSGAVQPSAELDGQPLKVWRDRDKKAWLVELPHSAGHGLPKAFEWHRNHANRADGLEEKGRGPVEDLASRLWLDGQTLRLKLVNRGEALQDLRLVWRLPLGWAKVPVTRRAALKHDGSLELDLPLTAEGPSLLREGRFYAAVQVDARRGAERLRLYSDVRAAAPPRDPSYPKGGFLVLGPLPGDRPDFDIKAFANRAMYRPKPRPCEALFADVSQCWEPTRPDREDPLHPEIIPAGAMVAPRTFYTWDTGAFYPYGHKLHYLLMGDIESPVSRTAKAYWPRSAMKRVVLNGRRVRGKALELKAGKNRLMLLYAAGTADAEGQGTFSEKNYGPFFRLVGTDNERLTDIKYVMPEGISETAKGKP